VKDPHLSWRRAGGAGQPTAMNIFEFRQRLIEDYAAYTRSFIQI